MTTPSLRKFADAEIQDLQRKLRRSVAALADDPHLKVSTARLAPSFGEWSRVAAPRQEPSIGADCVLYRHRSSDEYALLTIVDSSKRGAAGEALAEWEQAANQALVGDFLTVWQAVLDMRPRMAYAGLLFTDRLPHLSAEIQFLAAFSMTADTYLAAATARRPGLEPTLGSVRSQVDKMFWEAPEAVRETITSWALAEVSQFLSTVSNQSAVEDDSLPAEIEYLVDSFLNSQYDHDPNGVVRVVVDRSEQHEM